MEGKEVNESQSGMAEFQKRKNARLGITLPVIYSRIYDPANHLAKSINISQGGLMSHLPEPLETGEALRVQFFFSSSAIELKMIETSAQVIWRDPQSDTDGCYRTGLQFLNMAPIDLDALKKFLAVSLP